MTKFTVQVVLQSNKDDGYKYLEGKYVTSAVSLEKAYNNITIQMLNKVKSKFPLVRLADDQLLKRFNDEFDMLELKRESVVTRFGKLLSK